MRAKIAAIGLIILAWAGLSAAATSQTVQWAGGIPGYGEAVQAHYAVATGEARTIIVDGVTVQLPEAANWVTVSEGGQWAWQGHESGLIYAKLASTGVKGYGQHSFVFVGETLRSFSDVQTYQATAGGWRYVDEQGNIVPYGPTYSGPPLWEYTKFSDGLAIGQGPENGDGVQVRFPGESANRRLEAGDFFAIRAHRYGDQFVITAANLPQHFTRIWRVSLAELRALPIAASTPPPVVTPPVVTPPTSAGMPDRLADLQALRAQYPALMTDVQDGEMLARFAYAHRGEGFGLLRKDGGHNCPIPNSSVRVSCDWIIYGPGNVGCDAIGDSPDPGRPSVASPTWCSGEPAPGAAFMVPDPGVGTVTPPADSNGDSAPVGGTPTTVDLQPLLDRIAALEARVAALEATNAVGETRVSELIANALAGYAKKGDKVTVAVSGRISYFGVNNWGGTGTIDK